MCVKSNLYKVAFTFVLPPDHNSGPWCKMFLGSEENVVICRAHGCRIVGFIIHVLHPCVSPRKTSLACLPVCANCLVDVWTCHSCSYANPGWMTTWKDFLRVLGGAVRNSPERTMFFSSFWAELAELPTDVWLFPGISSACTSLDSHYLWCKVDQPSNNTEIGLNPNNQDAINRGRNSAKYRICRNFSASLSHASTLTQLLAIEALVSKFAKMQKMQKCKKCKMQNTCCQSSSKLAWPEK